MRVWSPPCPDITTTLFASPSLLLHLTPERSPPQLTSVHTSSNLLDASPSDIGPSQNQPTRSPTSAVTIAPQRLSLLPPLDCKVTSRSEPPSPTPSTAQRGICLNPLTHPILTYRIEGLCQQCVHARAHRLARFEARSIRNQCRSPVAVDVRRRAAVTVGAEQRGQQRRRGRGKHPGPLDDGPGRTEGVVDVDANGDGERSGNKGLKLNLAKFRSGVAGWMVTSPGSGAQTPVGYEAVGNGEGEGGGGGGVRPWKRPGWLSPSSVKSSLGLGPGRGRGKDGGEEDALSPEHFAVRTLLGGRDGDGSQDSLTTEGVGSRKESREVGGWR